MSTESSNYTTHTQNSKKRKTFNQTSFYITYTTNEQQLIDSRCQLGHKILTIFLLGYVSQPMYATTKGTKTSSLLPLSEGSNPNLLHQEHYKAFLRFLRQQSMVLRMPDHFATTTAIQTKRGLIPYPTG